MLPNSNSVGIALDKIKLALISKWWYRLGNRSSAGDRRLGCRKEENIGLADDGSKAGWATIGQLDKKGADSAAQRYGVLKTTCMHRVVPSRRAVARRVACFLIDLHGNFGARVTKEDALKEIESRKCNRLDSVREVSKHIAPTTLLANALVV